MVNTSEIILTGTQYYVLLLFYRSWDVNIPIKHHLFLHTAFKKELINTKYQITRFLWSLSTLLRNWHIRVILHLMVLIYNNNMENRWDYYKGLCSIKVDSSPKIKLNPNIKMDCRPKLHSFQIKRWILNPKLSSFPVLVKGKFCQKKWILSKKRTLPQY